MGIFSSKESHQRRWRQTTQLQWTEQALKTCRKDIAQKAGTREHNIKILVFGPTGCGKSSLCNGIKTALVADGEVKHHFGVGSTEEGSFTQDFDAWQWKNIILVDMAGVCDDDDIEPKDVENILLGEVPLKAKLTKTLQPDCTNGENDYTCVILVLKPGMDFSETMTKILGIAGKVVGKENVAYHLVLTHLDLVDRRFHDPKNLEHIFKTRAVEENVFKACELTGIPPNCTTFVRNYSMETESEIHCDALFIDTFKQIVNNAVEQAEKRDLKKTLYS